MQKHGSSQKICMAVVASTALTLCKHVSAKYISIQNYATSHVISSLQSTLYRCTHMQRKPHTCKAHMQGKQSESSLIPRPRPAFCCYFFACVQGEPRNEARDKAIMLKNSNYVHAVMLLVYPCHAHVVS